LITVTFDETGSGPGLYRGTVTFTSEAVPVTSQTVEVQLTIPGAAPTCNGDANGDGRVRSNEVTIAINNINRGCPGNLGAPMFFLTFLSR
jgi:hypothetical protein